MPRCSRTLRWWWVYQYDYRVRAQNTSGISDPSPVVGPVPVSYRLLVDEMRDSSLWYAHSGEIRFLTMQDLARAKEDADRVSGADGEGIVYRLPDSIAEVTIHALATSSDSALAMKIYSGPTPETMAQRDVRREILAPFRNEYRQFCPVMFTATEFPAADRYVRDCSGRQQPGRPGRNCLRSSGRVTSSGRPRGQVTY